MQIKVNIAASPDIATLVRRMQQFPELLKPYLRAASNAVALNIERQSKILAPVLTGRLRSSIATSLGIVSDIQAIVQTNVNYAEIVHEGLGYGKNSIPRPFMREGVEIAADENAKITKSQIEEAFGSITK